MKDIIDRISDWLKAQGVVGAMPIHMLVNECREEIKQLRAEVLAWKERFPQYEYRKQDECVSLKLNPSAPHTPSGQPGTKCTCYNYANECHGGAGCKVIARFDKKGGSK